MNIKTLLKSLLVAIPATAIISSCEDEVSSIGSTLVDGEVAIVVDSIPRVIKSETVANTQYDAKSTTKLLGRINIPQYGSLNCSFVSQLMSATRMNIPDTITVNDMDSMKMVLVVPRGSLTGDSLAPQQLTVYQLTKSLPSDIDNNFDPKGYYDPSNPIGSKSYTLSAIALNDSLFGLQSNITIPVDFGTDKGKQLARETFEAYKKTPELFQWPATFNEKFKGLYVEQNFGNGCIGLISSLRVYTYWHYASQKYVYDSEKGEGSYVPTVATDSICLFSSQPEVISSNIVNYNPSETLKQLVADGKKIITTPGGYSVNMTFPVKELLDQYEDDLRKMSVISKLSFEIPATTIRNDYDLNVAPHLLMVKKSERDSFFENNKVPDGKTSFYAAYNSSTGRYTFSGMREYLMDLLKKEEITADDVEFSLVPIVVTTEDVSGYTSSTTYVTSCAEYIGRPTLTQLDMDHAVIIFAFSRQEIK